MNQPLRAAVIGLGAMGRHHARILQEMPGVELAWVADPLGDRHHVIRRGTPIHPAIPKNPDVDLAVIAVPTTWHLPAAFELANAGVHLLIEKPLASTERNAREIIDAIDRAGVHAAVGHVERFNPALRELHKRLGLLGNLHMIQTVRSGPWHGRIIDTGVIRDLATHDLDLVEWLAGPIDTIHAETAHTTRSTHEDLATITGRTSHGTVYSCTTDWLSPAKTRCTRILGEHGTLVADAIKPSLTLHKHGKTPVGFMLDAAEPLRAELEAFLHLIRTCRRGSLASLADGLRAVTHADAALHGTPLRPPLEVAA